jgi:hypothetical protein
VSQDSPTNRNQAVSQHLQVYWNESIVAGFSPDSPDAQQQNNRTLDWVAAVPNWNARALHCIDTNPYSLSSKPMSRSCPKFKLTDQQFDTKKNTLRSWARSQKEQNPEFTLLNHAEDHGKLVDAKRLYQQGKPFSAGFEIVDNVVVATTTTFEYPRHIRHQWASHRYQRPSWALCCRRGKCRLRLVVRWLRQRNFLSRRCRLHHLVRDRRSHSQS